MTMAPTNIRPMPALLTAVRPAATVLTGVLAGAVLATWLSEKALGDSTPLWIAYHQAINPTFTRAFPLLAGLALIAALVAAATSWGIPLDRLLVLSAIGCLLIGLGITVIVHFPINAEIATWRSDAPPADWQQIRDRWLAAHTIRTAFAVSGFALLVSAQRRPRARRR